MTYTRTYWDHRNSPPNDARSRHGLNNIEHGIEQVHNFLGNGPNLGSSWGMWEDLRFPAEALKAAGVKDPAYSTCVGGLRAYYFSHTTQEEVYTAVQMPHAWDGSAIYPHVHWLASTGSATIADSPLWAIEYSWANLGSTFPAAATVYASTHYPAAAVVSKRHVLTSFDPIQPTTSQNGLSSMLLIRLYRDCTVAADDFEHGVFMCEFDLHYRIDMVGSRQELSK